MKIELHSRAAGAKQRPAVSPGKVLSLTIVLLLGACGFYGCTEFNPR